MNKRIFAVSDVHGHYAALMQALARAGFDEHNEEHIFLSCGDLFDRGKENSAVYSFVKGLPRKILIRGNHEDMLRDILARGYVTDTEISNGTDVTAGELLGEGAFDEHGRLDLRVCGERAGELVLFIDSMQDYFETENYIFTHGWLPIVFEGRTPRVDPCWRDASASDWNWAHLFEWQQMYEVRAMPHRKTIVCGHRSVWLGHMFDSMREPDCSEPFFGEGMIAIDSGTVRSGVIHALVIEDKI